MRLRVLGWTLAAAAILALVLFGLSSSRSSSPRAEAPALPREALSGQGVTLRRLLSRSGGNPVLVIFWASWCGPCAKEAPALERFSRGPEGRGRMVGVDWSDSLGEARAFIRRFGWSFPNLRDGDGTVGSAYRLTGLPTTFVLDGSGRIRLTLRGPQDESSLRAALARVRA
jgi:thiol-disulfide isomerase/thioredoxin